MEFYFKYWEWILSFKKIGSKKEYKSWNLMYKFVFHQQKYILVTKYA